MTAKIGPKEAQLAALRARKAANASVNKPPINKTMGERVIESLKEAVEIAQGKREPARATTVKIRGPEYFRQAQTKWRDKNADTNRQRAREGMRKTRARVKTGT